MPKRKKSKPAPQEEISHRAQEYLERRINSVKIMPTLSQILESQMQTCVEITLLGMISGVGVGIILCLIVQAIFDKDKFV